MVTEVKLAYQGPRRGELVVMFRVRVNRLCLLSSGAIFLMVSFLLKMVEMSLPRPISSLACAHWPEFCHCSFVTVSTQVGLGATGAESPITSEDGGRGSIWSHSGAGGIPVGGQSAF